MGKVRPPEEVAARKAKKEAKKAEKQAVRQATLAPAPAHGSGEGTPGLNPDGTPASLENRLNPKKTSYDRALKAAWSTMSKAEKQKLMDEDKANRLKLEHAPLSVPAKFPFETASSDHCETSPEAYGHIAPLLRLLARRLGKTEAELRIYDPYYCSGAVKRHLAALGFTSVHNECEDFYARLASGSTPEHDVVVSNPPYSEDPDGGPNHVSRLLRFCVGGGRPFLLNMPEYVASSAYYAPSFEEGQAPLLLSPLWRYHFWTPPKLREGVNEKGHRNPKLGIRCAPFAALWYVSLEPALSHAALLKRAARGRIPGVEAAGAEAPAGAEVPEEAGAPAEVQCRLCRTLEELPETRSAFRKQPGAGGNADAPGKLAKRKRRKKAGREPTAESADQPARKKAKTGEAQAGRGPTAESADQPARKKARTGEAQAETSHKPAKKKVKKTRSKG